MAINITGLGNANGIGFKSKVSGGGSGYLPPELKDSLVGLWKFDQNTNESPTRNIIKNTIKGKGGDLELLNFAYKANSSYNGYPEDFTSWNYNTGLIVSPTKVQNNGDAGRQLIYYHTSIRKEDVLEFKVKITLDEQSKIKYWYIKEDGTGTNITYSKSGTYTIPTSYFSKYTGENTWFGFEQLSGGCIIEQSPLYEGALVTDGKDDMIVSQKTVQEMGITDEITVVSMIHKISTDNNWSNLIGELKEDHTFVANRATNTDKTGIYGYTYNYKNDANIINNILGDKNDYIVRTTTSLGLINKYYITGFENADTITGVSQIAVYWTFISNKVLTTDEINQIIGYFKLDKYVTPQVIYDVKRQGLSNDTPEADWYLKDFSGNGHDMQLYNFAKTPESGINEEGGLQSDGVNDYGKAERLPIFKDYTVVADRALIGDGQGAFMTKSSEIQMGAFGLEIATGEQMSFGNSLHTSIVNKDRSITYMSTYSYNGQPNTKGTREDGSYLCLATIKPGDSRFSSVALWSLLLFPYSLSEFLLKRQLKKYKLGTLYPDMVEFRPVISGNIPYNAIEISQGPTTLYNKSINKTGIYLQEGSTVRVYIQPSGIDEVSKITINEVEYTDLPINPNGYYYADFPITKSPQKISYAIDEYIRYEDIVQPYPAIINLKQDGKTITWGDKLKVDSDIVFAGSANLLPELYTVSDTRYNGVTLHPNTIIKVEKSMVFDNARTYLKANEPSCILSPNRLRIPNSSYKILGYIPDISGHGNHGVINNSAYAEMSGANGYTEFEFSKWQPQTSRAEFTISNDVKLNITKVIIPRRAILHAAKGYYTTNSIQRYKVTGVDENHPIVFGNDAPFDALLTVTTDGEYEVDWKTYGKNPCIFTTWTGDCNITIEQIGEYEGAYCLDGVDDFVTIPTLSHGGKQVFMKINWNKSGMMYDQRRDNNLNSFAIYIPNFNNNEDSIAYSSRNDGKTYIDGVLNTSVKGSQLKDVTHNITITNSNSNNDNTVSPAIGSNAKYNAFYAQMALFDFMLFPEISSEDEIKKLNDVMGIEGGYVESPDYYWDAYGKNNLAALDIDYQDLFQSGDANKMLIDKSKAGLAALELYHNSGNNSELINRRLVANNFAYNGESGYSEIADTWLFNQWIVYNNMYIEREQINNTTIRITKSNIASVDSFYARKNINKKAYYKITGLQQGQAIQFGFTDDVIYTAESDGVHEVDWSLSKSRMYQELGCTFVGDCNITIEQVAQYQNGLVSDGVEDYLNNTVIPAFTDFTVIAKRVWRNKDEPLNECFIHKGVVNTPISQSAFMLEYEITDDTYYRSASFGGYINVERVNRPESITYQTTKSYNGTPIIKGSGIDTQGLVIGAVTNNYWKGVFYKMMLYSKTIDMLSINMLKNLFAKDELIDVNNPIFKKQ